MAKFKSNRNHLRGLCRTYPKALAGKEGVLDHEVKYPGDNVREKFDPTKIKREYIQQVIIALGYKAEPVEAGQ